MIIEHVPWHYLVRMLDHYEESYISSSIILVFVRLHGLFASKFLNTTRSPIILYHSLRVILTDMMEIDLGILIS